VPNWVVGIAGTFVLSLFLAYVFLRLRCRGAGYPFGPRARPWGIFIMVATAIVSAGAGLLVVAASRQIHTAFVGIIMPGGLWFGGFPPQGDKLSSGRSFPAVVWALPFSRLYDRMGDDMQDWCDTRLRAASPKPKWIADAVTYYSDQVRCGLRDGQTLANLGRWHESIAHKIGIVRMIGSDASPARVRAALQMHPATQNMHKYADDELPLLADRLESDALNELHLFLAYVYRLGHHKLLIYPFRPSAQRVQVRRREPISPDL
jgi:hypothetical protein